MKSGDELQIARVAETALSQLSENNADMRTLVVQMGQIAASLNERVRTLETIMMQRITITGAQAKMIQSAVRDRARAICGKYALDYARHGEAVRRAIWRDLKVQYRIADIHDLPAAYYDLSMKKIQGWTSFELVRKLRDK